MVRAAPHRWIPTLSRTLQITAAIMLVLITAVTIQQLLQLRAGQIADAARQMSRLDMVFAEQTGRAIESVDLILREITGRLARNAQPAVETDDELRRAIDGVRQVSEIDVVDAAGHTLFSSRAAGAAPFVLPPAGMALLGPAAQDPPGQPLISAPVRDASGRWTAFLARGLRGPDGRPAGMAVASLALSYFEDFYKAVELDEDGAILLHLRDGTVLARYPHVDSVVGTSFAALPPFADVLAHAQAGTTEMTGPVDGKRRILAIRALRAFPLAVNISVSEADVLAPWRRQTSVFVLSALLASVALGSLLLLLARAASRRETLLGEFRIARDSAEGANAQLLVQMEERARAEAALRQAQRIEAVGQLTGGVAHDFNNLLTVLLGNIDLLQQTTPLDPTAMERLERMRTAAERGATLTDQLLAFSRRQPLIPRAVALNEVVGGMIGLLQSAIGSTIRIETRLEDPLWPALVDPTQLELVILNLSINARDAMPQGGVLTIATANAPLGPPLSEDAPPEGDYVMVSVADTGSGMTEEVLAKAFEPFFTTKAPGEGSGLGLSQVFGVARQSGGDVRLDSDPATGTSVQVFLPRAATEPCAKAAAAPFPPEQADSTILLVDDDEAVRSTTRLILETMGYTVADAQSGREALARLGGDEAFDILLTDVAMPGMNGPELARQVRLLRPHMPVVFFSGYADPDEVAGDIVLERMVRKPFRAAELAAQIEAALSDHRASA